MKKISNNKVLDYELIAIDMVDMQVFKIEDIKKYGFSDDDAIIIKKYIDRK